jgi:hypothetical protein
MPATSVAIFSPLPPTAAPFLSGARAERAAFSPLAWSQRNLRLVPTTPLTKPSRGGDRRQDDAAGQRADAALVDPRWRQEV